MSDNDPSPDCRGDWRLYGWFPIVLAVGILDLARRACRRVLRRARRTVSHALYEASCLVDPESVPDPDLPKRAATRWRERCLLAEQRRRSNGRPTGYDGP